MGSSAGRRAGLFVGERHVYAVPQIDDFFLASAIYTGGTYRINAADLQALADWQNLMRAQPLTADFRLAWAVNGQGSQSMPGDPLTAKALALGPTFSWINHSWDHPVLDGLSYADVADGVLAQRHLHPGPRPHAVHHGERGDAEHFRARQRRRHAGDS